MEIYARNVNSAFPQGIDYLLKHGVEEQSRNGVCLVAPEPVVTVYYKPEERVLMSSLRDANPFFHLMESLWMLAGHNDIAFPSFFAKNLSTYSDDGITQHGAYGHRWRQWWGFDQLQALITELRDVPETRRAVLMMWDPEFDLIKSKPSGGGLKGKDIPCNIAAVFDRRGGKLNMSVFCRSNDIIWGAYGANAVHFSILQEYMAAAVGVSLGVYRQISVNYHAYLDVYDRTKLLDMAENATEPYAGGLVTSHPLVSTDIEIWDSDLSFFMEDPMNLDICYKDPFFAGTVAPMYRSWRQRKSKEGNGLLYAKMIAADDWRVACCNWIVRRENKETK